MDTVGDSIDPLTIIQFLRSQFGVQILLHEGGLTLFGQFLAAKAVDKLFLTLSPQIAGRAARTNRPGIVQGVEFAPDSAPWYELLSLRQRAGHLYLRYECKREG
jgi:riboflavin biosynthesis pyrimidine reductase